MQKTVLKRESIFFHQNNQHMTWTFLGELALLCSFQISFVVSFVYSEMKLWSQDTQEPGFTRSGAACLEVSCRFGMKWGWIKADMTCVFFFLCTISWKCHTCGSKAASVSGDVISKYDGPHTGLSWSTFTHQEHLQIEQRVISSWRQRRNLYIRALIGLRTPALHTLHVSLI